MVESDFDDGPLIVNDAYFTDCPLPGISYEFYNLQIINYSRKLQTIDYILMIIDY